MTSSSFSRTPVAMLLVASAVLLFAASGMAQAAGETLAHVKSRGELRCGVSDGIAGFSSRSDKGEMTGLDADYCRAVAAAVLGDAKKVKFIQLRASERIPALKGDMIDLLARNTTWTLGREAALKVMFAGVLYYDGQGFMVRKKLDQTADAKKTGNKKTRAPVKKAAGTNLTSLDKATICVEKGTTHLQHLTDFFAASGLSFEPLVIDSAKGVADAFFAGRCTAYTSDMTQLAAARATAPGSASAYTILPERISKEPLGPLVRAGDDDWLTLTRWVLFALVAAEEYGITQDNVRGPLAQRVLANTGDAGKALGLDAEWLLRAIQSVGNYGEIFERNLGRNSPLNIARGLNQPWTQGGLMYAPPMR